MQIDYKDRQRLGLKGQGSIYRLGPDGETEHQNEPRNIVARYVTRNPNESEPLWVTAAIAQAKGNPIAARALAMVSAAYDRGEITLDQARTLLQNFR